MLYMSSTSRVSININYFPVHMDMYYLFPYLLPAHIAGTICREGIYGDRVGHMYTLHVKYSRVMVKFMHHILFFV